MEIGERLLKLGYKKKSIHAALLSFQKDYNISSENYVTPLTTQRLKELTDGNIHLNLLARIIYSESSGEPYLGKVAVGAVVLNRLKSSQFPNSYTGVITQPLAFTVIANRRFWLKPNAVAFKAAKAALSGVDPTDNALYFFNPDKATSKWILRLQPKLRIGRHVFA